MQDEQKREPECDAKAAEPCPDCARYAPDEVTEAMNQVVDQLDEPIDPFVTAAGRRILERVEW